MIRVTQAEFARQADLAKSTVTRWIQTGRISPPGDDGLLDLEQAMRERAASESPLARDQARKAQFDAQKAARRAAGRTPRAPTRGAAGRAPGAPQGMRESAPVPAPAPEGNEQNVERLGMALKLETYKLQKAKAELANIELDQRAGLLVERAEVDFVLADFGNTLRGYLEGLADRLAPEVAGHRGDLASLHRLIDDRAREVLEQIAEHIARRMETLEKPQ